MVTLGLGMGFRAEASLPLTHGVPEITDNTTKFCLHHSIGVSVSYWSGSLLIYFYCSDSDKMCLVRYADVELTIKPWLLTSIRNIWIAQQFFMHCFSSFLFIFLYNEIYISNWFRFGWELDSNPSLMYVSLCHWVYSISRALSTLTIYIPSSGVTHHTYKGVFWVWLNCICWTHP